MQRAFLSESLPDRASRAVGLAGARLGLPIVLLVSLGGLGCETPTQADPDTEQPIRFPESDYPIQTELFEYVLRPDTLTVPGVRALRTEIWYMFTNRTAAPVYLLNCRGGFDARLQREQDGAWHTAWAPPLLRCLSPPIVIDQNATFIAPLPVWAAPHGSNIAPQFDVEDPSGTYRILWADAFSSFMDAYPFGTRLPLELRVSNPFTLRK